MSHYYQTDAITLSRKDARENDRIFSFYTENHGKVFAQVTSAKKIKSRLAGHLEPFGVANVGIVRGLRRKRVASAQMKFRYGNILLDTEKIACAGNCVRLVDEFVREGVPDSQIYHLLSSCLAALDEENINGNIKIFNAIFSLKLLSLLGYRPQVENCVVCSKSLQEERNIFSLRHGGTQCAHHESGSDEDIEVCPNDIKLLRLALRAEIRDTFKIKAEQGVYKKLNLVVAGFLKFHIH